MSRLRCLERNRKSTSKTPVPRCRYSLKAPESSILSDQFLAEVKGLPQRNLAFEALKKLLNDELKVRAKKNLVQSRLFSQMLEESIRK